MGVGEGQGDLVLRQILLLHPLAAQVAGPGDDGGQGVARDEGVHKLVEPGRVLPFLEKKRTKKKEINVQAGSETYVCLLQIGYRLVYKHCANDAPPICTTRARGQIDLKTYEILYLH